LALALAALAIALAVYGHTPFAQVDITDMVLPITFSIAGLVVATRLPRNPLGWLFLFMAVNGGTDGVASGIAGLSAISHSLSATWGQWAQWWLGWTGPLTFPAGAATMTMTLLPDGRPASRFRKWVIVAGVVVTLVISFPMGAFAPGPMQNDSSVPGPYPNNPLGVGLFSVFSQQVIPTITYFVGLFIVLLAATSPLARMRRASAEERQQLKWIAYALVLTTVGFILVSVGGIFWPALNSSIVSNAIIALGYGVAFPGATAIAILKYRLYDIDVAINRTVVYGSLAVFITSVYVGIAVGIGALVGSGGKPNLALSIIATAVVAIGFQPVSNRVQRVANRLVYGKRATPYEVLSAFSDQVAATDADEEVLPRMARILQEGTTADLAVVWLRGVDGLHAAAVYPTQPSPQPSLFVDEHDEFNVPDADRAVPVRYQGELLGALSIRKRRGESLTMTEQKLVDDLAHQAGLVLKNVRLTQELLRRLDELRASRQRLVTAQDHERRRLERNLHDGAQQHLVALKVKLGLAQMLSTRDPERAKATVSELKLDADEALETLRELARGIYPPLLADKGLAVALESQARKATLPVIIDADGLGRYSQDVEAAVYFCVLEALQNTQKYAKASHATVHLSDNDGAVGFEITDDGVGFDRATAKKGAGLTNMGDRLDALGGSIEMESSLGKGTVLKGSIPASALAVAV